MSFRRNESMTAKDLVEVRDIESRDAEYITWKREKIEAAIQHADKHPDQFLTEQEIWKKHGLAN